MRPRRVGDGLERGVVGGRLEEDAKKVAIVWSSAAGEFEDVNSSELSSCSAAVLRRLASIAIVMISSWMAGSTDASRWGADAGGTLPSPHAWIVSTSSFLPCLSSTIPASKPR